MKIVSKAIEVIFDGSEKELEKKLSDLKSKYRVLFEDIYYNDDLDCYTMHVKYVEKGIY